MNTELRQVREMRLILWRGHTGGMTEGRNGEIGSEGEWIGCMGGHPQIPRRHDAMMGDYINGSLMGGWS